MTHFIVIGIGAVGGFYSAKLIQHYGSDSINPRISLVARGVTYQEIQARGLGFVDNQKPVVFVKANVYDSFGVVPIDPDELTIVFLCTKSKDTVAISHSIAQRLNPNLVVVSVQNGVDNENKISEVLGKEHVIGALINIGAQSIESGLIKKMGSESLIIGELNGLRSKRVEEIYSLIKASGINIKISQNIEVDLWSKLVWNASFNSLSVLYRATTGRILENPAWRKELEGIMQEVVEVAQAKGINLPENIIEKQIEHTNSEEWYEFKTSTLQDLERGREIEIEELLGVIVQAGKDLGLTLPYSNNIYTRIMASTI